jgi:hypothetical protein
MKFNLGALTYPFYDYQDKFPYESWSMVLEKRYSSRYLSMLMYTFNRWKTLESECWKCWRDFLWLSLRILVCVHATMWRYMACQCVNVQHFSWNLSILFYRCAPAFCHLTIKIPHRHKVSDQSLHRVSPYSMAWCGNDSSQPKWFFVLTGTLVRDYCRNYNLQKKWNRGSRPVRLLSVGSR